MNACEPFKMVSILQPDFLMNKSALTIVCALVVTGAAFAQGTVDWGSIPFNVMTAQTNTTQFAFGVGSSGFGTSGLTASATTSGLSYYYELLYNSAFTGSQVSAPTYGQLFDGTWLDTGLTATNSRTPGRLSPVNPNLAATVPWAQGTTNNIILVGWSANLGTSWATVSNELATQNFTFLSSEAFFGESATGYISPNTGAPFGASLFATGATANGLPIFSLNTQLYWLPLTIITPEPSMLALIGLGGLSLLLLRRRK